MFVTFQERINDLTQVFNYFSNINVKVIPAIYFSVWWLWIDGWWKWMNLVFFRLTVNNLFLNQLNILPRSFPAKISKSFHLALVTVILESSAYAKFLLRIFKLNISIKQILKSTNTSISYSSWTTSLWPYFSTLLPLWQVTSNQLSCLYIYSILQCFQ